MQKGRVCEMQVVMRPTCWFLPHVYTTFVVAAREISASEAAVFGCKWRFRASIVTVLHYVKLFASSDLFAKFGQIWSTLKGLKLRALELKVQSGLIVNTTVSVNMYKRLVWCNSIASTALLSYIMCLPQSPVYICLSVR